MRAIITVIGKDTVGIIAKVSAELSKNRINILDITQSVLDDLFAMVCLVDISNSDIPFSELAGLMEEAGAELGVKVHVMHEDIFNSMHRI